MWASVLTRSFRGSWETTLWGEGLWKWERAGTHLPGAPKEQLGRHLGLTLWLLLLCCAESLVCGPLLRAAAIGSRWRGGGGHHTDPTRQDSHSPGTAHSPGAQPPALTFPSVLSWKLSTRAASVHLAATRRAAFRRRSWKTKNGGRVKTGITEATELPDASPTARSCRAVSRPPARCQCITA